MAEKSVFSSFIIVIIVKFIAYTALKNKIHVDFQTNILLTLFKMEWTQNPFVTLV